VGPKLWKTLPIAIRESETLDMFKKKTLMTLSKSVLRQIAIVVLNVLYFMFCYPFF